jgi:uncharacterized protein YutE (UPF0331/DUF86 family)
MDEQDVVLERLKLLNEYVNDLLELQDVDLQTYTENKLIHRTVERTLHLAVEACLDIGQHIIAQEGFRTPEDNKDVFVVLSEEEIVPLGLLPRLINMAKFRNLIVHDYARIDNSAVFGILKRHLGDFDAFAQAIVRYLEIRQEASDAVE